MYSPDSAFTGRHPVVGSYPSGMSRARSSEQFDFVSCFSQHIFDYEKAGKKGSAANYRASFRLLLSYLNGLRLTPRQFTVRWVERYECWLRARGVTTNTVIFHLAQPPGGLQPGRQETADSRPPTPPLRPTVRQAERDPQTGAVACDAQTDPQPRPLVVSPPICPCA